LVVVALAEFALRRAGLGDPVLYYETVAPYRYAPRPNQTRLRRHGARVSIDQYGLRGTDVWDRGDAVARILFVGDSVTYGGSYIDDTDLFSARTCTALRQRFGVDAVCGNAGVNAYGTDNMAGAIRFRSPPGVDLYVVTLVARDCVRNQAALRTFPYFSARVPGPVPGLTEVALYLLDYWRSRLRFAPIEGQDQETTRAVASASLRQLRGALDEVATGDHARVLLVYSASSWNIEHGYDDFEQFVADELLTLGFDVLETLPALREAPAPGLFHDSAHLERGGHQVYGDRIAATIVERGLLRSVDSVSGAPVE